jgi:hypothetical protein
MATDPSDIELSPEQKKLLARYADAIGVSWREAFNMAVSGSRIDEGWLRAQQETLGKVWDNDEDSAYDEL